MIAHAQPPRLKNLTPDEYLSLCRQVSALPEDQRQRRINALTAANTYSVDGNVELGEQRDRYTVLIPAKINGDLLIGAAPNIKHLDGLAVTRDVEADGSGVEKITDSFSCGGHLSVIYCKELRSISGKIGRDVFAFGCGLEQTTPNFCCGGSLYKNLTAATQYLAAPAIQFKIGAPIGDRFHTLAGRVARNVHAGCGALSSIDESFECGGNMQINDCPNLKTLAGKAKGCVDASSCGIENISPNFEARNDRTVSDSPWGLWVEGCKNLRQLDGKVPSGARTDGVLPLGPNSEYGQCLAREPDTSLHHTVPYYPKPVVSNDSESAPIAGRSVPEIVSGTFQRVFGFGNKSGGKE